MLSYICSLIWSVIVFIWLKEVKCGFCSLTFHLPPVKENALYRLRFLKQWQQHLEAKPGRVARWFTFKSKVPIWVYFRGSCNGNCWSILWPFGLFNSHLVYFTAIWSILRPFGLFFPVLVCCTKKNLATLKPGPKNWLFVLSSVACGAWAEIECHNLIISNIKLDRSVDTKKRKSWLSSSLWRHRTGLPDFLCQFTKVEKIK
jgi:hypothetical protein